MGCVNSIFLDKTDEEEILSIVQNLQKIKRLDGHGYDVDCLHMNSLEEIQLWCPGVSLWSLIAEHVCESELLKIRAALGHSLVDMYTDVHNEAVMWHKIWQGRQQHGNHNSRAENPSTRPQSSPLSDPPVVKELLRAEVKMLLQTLKEKTCRTGRDDVAQLFGYKPETVHYALSHQETCYSNSVNFENVDNAKRPSSCCSVQSSAEDEIESIKDKINVTEIHTIITQLRSVFLSESEALSALAKILKGNIKQKHQGGPCMTEPSLTELRELRAAIQTDLKLLPSSAEVSPPPPVMRQKTNFRMSARQMSGSPLPLSPASTFRPDLTSLCPLTPKPPSPHPPSKNSLFRTHSLQTYSPSPENHASSQSCIHLPSTDLSLRRERKNIPAWTSRDSNISSSSAPALRRVSDAGSYSGDDIGRSVSTKGILKGQDGQQTSSSGNSSESTVVQLDNCERLSSSRSLVVSETPAQPGRKKHERLVHREKTERLRVDTDKQQGPNSCSLTDNASHPPESRGAHRRDSCTQPHTAETNGKYVVSPKNTQEKKTNQPISDQHTQTKLQVPKMFYQPVCSEEMQMMSVTNKTTLSQSERLKNKSLF